MTKYIVLTRTNKNHTSDYKAVAVEVRKANLRTHTWKECSHEYSFQYVVQKVYDLLNRKLVQLCQHNGNIPYLDGWNVLRRDKKYVEVFDTLDEAEREVKICYGFDNAIIQNYGL